MCRMGLTEGHAETDIHSVVQLHDFANERGNLASMNTTAFRIGDLTGTQKM